VIAALLAAFLLIAVAYHHQMAVAGNPGRHRETPTHPGWEVDLDELVSLHRTPHHS
jgi:hypothetical protein